MPASSISYAAKSSIFVAVLLSLSFAADAAEDHAAHQALSPKQLAQEAVYAERCSTCHDAATGRTPSRTALLFVTPRIIERALTRGAMAPMADGMTGEQIHALAMHLSALPDRAPVSAPDACGNKFAASKGSNSWPSTSLNSDNTRFQPAAGIAAEDIANLDLAWVLAIPGGAAGSPVIHAGTLYISSGDGRILALDASTGCKRWEYEHGRIVRTLTVAPPKATGGAALAVFADDTGHGYALDAKTGQLRWKTAVEDHPLNRATGAPAVHDGLVFVTMSSIEDPLTHDPRHTCCTSRGSVTAIDAQSGEIAWKQFTVADAPREVAAASESGPARFSPAGGSIYTPLAIDAKRGLLYATTAEAYTDEDAIGAYSVIAMEMKTGARRWERQFLPEPEARDAECAAIGDTDCRNVFSMGTSVLIHRGERDLLLVGQKWGFIYALDPDDRGATVWSRRVARGGDMGGIMYGLADDGERVYVPISDMYAKAPERPGDLVALSPTDGSVIWRARQPNAVCSWGSDASCVGAQSAAPTAIPGVVFATSWDGFVRAHASDSGAIVWQFDTGRKFPAINGHAQGGQIAAYPVQVVDGYVYVTSGASSQARPGNALLVFRVAD